MYNLGLHEVFGCSCHDSIFVRRDMRVLSVLTERKGHVTLQETGNYLHAKKSDLRMNLIGTWTSWVPSLKNHKTHISII